MLMCFLWGGLKSQAEVFNIKVTLQWKSMGSALSLFCSMHVHQCYFMVFLLPISPRRTFRQKLVCWSLKVGAILLAGPGQCLQESQSAAQTPTELRSHRGHVCVRSGQENHPSNMPATRLKLTERDRVSETHIQRSLMGAEARKDAVPKTFPAKSQHIVPGERPALSHVGLLPIYDLVQRRRVCCHQNINQFRKATCFHALNDDKLASQQWIHTLAKIANFHQ